MKLGGVSRGLGAALVALMLVAPAAIAQGLELYPTPKTAEAEQVRTLFNIVLWIAMVVFVFVEGLLIYVIWRFRKNKSVPKGETHRGHTRAEIAWSVVPALILIFIGAISVQTLETLDKIPEPDIVVGVEAQQFAWTFTYPDGSSSINKMYVEEGQTVRLDITATDVIHAVWIPEFALKIDAVPGRVNQQWFHAPPPGEFFLQCAEYCGVGHHAMRASVVTFAQGSQENPWGAPPRQDSGEDIPVDVEFDARLLESGGESNSAPWSIDPPTLQVAEGQGVRVNSINDGKGIHNLTIPAFDVTTPEQPAGSTESITFVADRAGTFEYFCGIPGHRELGMRGFIEVTPA